MNGEQERLWPFDTRAALLAAVAIWFVVAIIFVTTSASLGWPDDESMKLAALIVIALGLIPIAFRLLDFAASRRAVLDIKGVKIDFSGVDLTKPEVRRETPGIPDNIGVSGPIVSDTSPMNIIDTLKDATKHELVVVDLKAGDAWWVTRLLALSSGAVRAGSPRAIVFVGKKQNRDHQYVGWAQASDVLDGVLRAKQEYSARHVKAMRIAKQVVMYGQNEFLPQQPAPFLLHPEVLRYVNDQRFVGLGDAVAEQILMDQLAVSVPGPSLEDPPDWLTLGRLNDLFGHCLDSISIDLSWPKEKQIAALLDSRSSYVALVREGRYESMIKEEDGERLILRELFLQSQRQ